MTSFKLINVIILKVSRIVSISLLQTIIRIFYVIPLQIVDALKITLLQENILEPKHVIPISWSINGTIYRKIVHWIILTHKINTLLGVLSPLMDYFKYLWVPDNQSRDSTVWNLSGRTRYWTHEEEEWFIIIEENKMWNILIDTPKQLFDCNNLVCDIWPRQCPLIVVIFRLLQYEEVHRLVELIENLFYYYSW